MTDVRLIDANALRNVFDAMHAIHGGSHIDHLILLGIKNFIDEAPTIEVVQVVRCKDCKEYIYPAGVCKHWNRPVRCDGYCNCGAKMDGGAQE